MNSAEGTSSKKMSPPPPLWLPGIWSMCHGGGGGGHPFFADVSLVEFKYLTFIRMTGGVTVGDTGPSCVLCLSIAVISLR